ncbi:MAG TPA: glycosyltransferase [Chitinophagaceae bacterium]|nr:glycosyltransferase [Chitinophagaceae bacterium]
MAQRKIDIVIADCRFGLYNKEAFCVLMTHQLTIKSPFGKWMERLLRKWNYNFINKFNECWVPDFSGNKNLAGELSHPPVMPQSRTKYIGWLSRINAAGDVERKTYDVAVILSGPEPQRTLLENIVLKELSAYSGKAALVRGLPGETGNISLPAVTIFNHLSSDELSRLMMSSALIISRSGYTTVMDLVKIRKKSILIPTPGQPEQEYLGRYLMQQKLCVCMKQDEFSLAGALEMAAEFSYEDMSGFDMEYYKQAIINTLTNY